MTALLSAESAKRVWEGDAAAVVSPDQCPLLVVVSYESVAWTFRDMLLSVVTAYSVR